MPSDTLPALTDAELDRIVAILHAHGVLHASLFGSYARGDQHPADDTQPESDIDLVIELPRGKSLLDLSALGIELEDELGRRFDLVTAFESLHPRIQERIRRDRKVLL